MRVQREQGMKAPRKTGSAVMKHELMIRRAANHNVHVITPHGKVVAGRKGRRG